MTRGNVAGAVGFAVNRGTGILPVVSINRLGRMPMPLP